MAINKEKHNTKDELNVKRFLVFLHPPPYCSPLVHQSEQTNRVLCVQIHITNTIHFSTCVCKLIAPLDCSISYDVMAAASVECVQYNNLFNMH